MTYRLKYQMLLPVEGMIDEDGADLTAGKAAAALRAMADRLEAEPKLLKEIFGRPWDAECEDRWVLRSKIQPNVIRKASGGWVSVDLEDLDPADTLSSEEIASLSPGPGSEGIWVLPEDIGGLPVVGAMQGWDGSHLGECDLRNFLAIMMDDAIREHLKDGWDFSEAILEAASQDGQPAFDYAKLLFKLAGRERFQVIVEEADIPRAIAYLDEIRPGLVDSAGVRPAEADSPAP